MKPLRVFRLSAAQRHETESRHPNLSVQKRKFTLKTNEPAKN
jgi:hypothetical protein